MVMQPRRLWNEPSPQKGWRRRRRRRRGALQSLLSEALGGYCSSLAGHRGDSCRLILLLHPFFLLLEATQPLNFGAESAVTPWGSATRGSTKSPWRSLIPKALRKEVMLSRLPRLGGGTGRRQSWRLNLALWEGAKHGPRGRSAAQTLHAVGAASPTHVRPQKSQGRGHVPVGCSALGREADFSCHGASCPLRLVFSLPSAFCLFFSTEQFEMTALKSFSFQRSVICCSGVCFAQPCTCCSGEHQPPPDNPSHCWIFGYHLALAFGEMLGILKWGK